MLRQRLAVQPPHDDGIARQGLLASEAASERNLDLEFLCSPLDVFLAAIGAEKDEFTGGRLDRRSVEDSFQRDAGPASVAAQSVERPAVPRALEPGNQVGAPHLLEIVE